MTWGKVDDQLHAHPKVLGAWHSYRASLGLWLLALSYANSYLTDGHVPQAFVRDKLPGVAERRRSLTALTDFGLWVPSGPGFEFHDFHDFNDSRDAVLSKHPSRARGRGRAQAGAGARAPAQAPAGGRGPDPSPYPFPSTPA